MDRARNAEVAQLDPAILPNQRVVRRHVPVDDVEGDPGRRAGPMGVGKAPRDLPEDPARDVHGKVQLALSQLAQNVPKRAADHEFHRHEEGVIVSAEIERLHAVGAADVSSDACLVHEHRGKLTILHEMRQNGLERDNLLEARLPGDTCHPDRSHSARCQTEQELVFAEDGPWTKRRRIGGAVGLHPAAGDRVEASIREDSAPGRPCLPSGPRLDAPERDGSCTIRHLS